MDCLSEGAPKRQHVTSAPGSEETSDLDCRKTSLRTKRPFDCSGLTWCKSPFALLLMLRQGDLLPWS